MRRVQSEVGGGVDRDGSLHVALAPLQLPSLAVLWREWGRGGERGEGVRHKTYQLYSRQVKITKSKENKNREDEQLLSA